MRLDQLYRPTLTESDVVQADRLILVQGLCPLQTYRAPVNDE